MLKTILIIVLMMAIGAAIGGVTNSLAIKMLFRPFHAKYIGKTRLPFTPGLIPKRRGELANQLGDMVVEHLLTPEGLRRKFLDASFQKQMEKWVQSEVERVLTSDQTLEQFAKQHHIPLSEDRIKRYLHDLTIQRYNELMETYRKEALKDIAGDRLVIRGKESLPAISGYVLQQIDSYISSDAGKEKLTSIIEKYLEGQGFLGNMVSSFLGNDGIADRIQPAISRYITSDEAKEWLTSLLEMEYDKWTEKDIAYFEGRIGADTLSDWLAKAVTKAVPVKDWMDRSIKEHSEKIRPYIVQEMVPELVSYMGAYLSERIPQIMEKLHLSDIVKQEVESFSVERIEHMVLGISRREFKMITYLGALLGGLIGFVQGMIVMLIG